MMRQSFPSSFCHVGGLLVACRAVMGITTSSTIKDLYQFQPDTIPGHAWDSTSSRAPLKPLLNRGDESRRGGRSGNQNVVPRNIPIERQAFRFCALEFSTWRRTVRRGVELFDVASNFSTWRRTFRCWKSKSRGGEQLPPRPRLFPPFPVQRADALQSSAGLPETFSKSASLFA